MADSERCMCGLVHVSKGTLILGAMMLISGACGILNDLMEVGKNGFGATVATVLINAIYTAIGGVTVYAVKKENHKLIWPFMISQAVFLGFLGVAALVTVILQFFPTWVAEKADMAKGDESPEDYTGTVHVVLGISTILVGLAALIPIWYASVAKRCHDIIKAKNDSTAQQEMSQKA